MSLNLEVQILGEFKSLTKATKGATKQLENFQGRVRGIARSINGTLAAIGVGLSLNALTSGIRSAVNEASNLEESINAVRVSFGPAAEAILAIGQNSAKSFGLARSEFNAAAVTFSAFADEIVGPGGDAADFIEQITTRGADFASVFNIEVDEALRVFRSGLSGESEPLKRFGIILNDTAVKAFAYKNRIAETGRELTNTQKVQARYQLLLEETAKTQGDFANTSGSLANSLRIARAAFSEVTASIGQGFAPAIAAVAQFITDNIGVFTALGDAIGTKLKSAFDTTGDSATAFGGKLIKVVEDFTAFLNGTAEADNGFVKLQETIGPILEIFGALGEVFKGVLAVLNGLFDGLFGWINLFLPAGEQVSGLAGFLTLLGKGLQDIGYWIGYAGSFLVPFTGAFKILGGVLGAFSKTGQGIVKFFQGIGENIAGVFGGATKRLDDLDKAAKSGKGISKGIKEIDAAIKNGAAYDKASDAVKRLDPALENLSKKFDANKQGLKELDQAGGLVRSTLGGVAEAIQNINGKKIVVKVDFRVGGATTGEENRFNNLRQQIANAIVEDDPSPTGGTGDTPFQTRVKAIVAKLTQTLEEAKARIKNASESFRDAVGLSFGVITNGFTARFSVGKVIAQMKRIKDAVKTFSKDIIELRKKGADAALIDELIGLGPLAGSVAARELVTSGSLNEFLNLRKDLASSGAAVGAAGNLAINGTSTSGLQNAINGLNRTIAAGKGNTYNISIANPNITPQQIIAEIKAYEKKTGKKVFSN